jgi:hypothetical protein
MERYSGCRGVLCEPPATPRNFFDHLNFNRSIAVVDFEAIPESKLLYYPYPVSIFFVEEPPDCSALAEVEWSTFELECRVSCGDFRKAAHGKIAPTTFRT